jgi:ketosteroid isomerase-like protein
MPDYRSIVTALYAASGKGDWAAAEQMLTDDFFITEAPHVPMAGIFRGRQALQNLYKHVFGLIDVQGLEVHDVTVGDSHAVCLLDMLLPGTPPVRVALAEMFRFRGDQVCEIRPYYFDPAPLFKALRAA